MHASLVRSGCSTSGRGRLPRERRLHRGKADQAPSSTETPEALTAPVSLSGKQVTPAGKRVSVAA